MATNNKQQFIARSGNSAGIGDTLEEAFEDLNDYEDGVDFDDVNFYRVTELEVEQQIVEIVKPIEKIK